MGQISGDFMRRFLGHGRGKQPANPDRSGRKATVCGFRQRLLQIIRQRPQQHPLKRLAVHALQKIAALDQNKTAGRLCPHEQRLGKQTETADSKGYSAGPRHGGKEVEQLTGPEIHEGMAFSIRRHCRECDMPFQNIEHVIGRQRRAARHLYLFAYPQEELPAKLVEGRSNFCWSSCSGTAAHSADTVFRRSGAGRFSFLQDRTYFNLLEQRVRQMQNSALISTHAENILCAGNTQKRR